MKKYFFYAILLFALLFSIIKCSNNDSSKVDTGTNPSIIDNSDSIDTTTYQRQKTAQTSLLPLIKVDSADFIKIKKNSVRKSDEFSEGVFYQDKLSPKYVNQNGFYLYISKSESNETLRFCIQYLADDWLFIKKAIFNIDGENVDFYPEDFKKDNGDGEIWEWSDSEVSESTLSMLEKIAVSKKTKVKLVGSEYFDVKTITPNQKSAIKNMLMLYKGFKLYGG